MKKLANILSIVVVLCGLILVPGAWALPYSDGSGNSFNPGDQRSPAATLDDQCTYDYIGFRYGGGGGDDGPGVTTWPGGTFGGNYGQLCFVTDCDNVIDTAYAYCFDLDHGLERDPYCVNRDTLVISDDTCSYEQLTALGFILAWCHPTTTMEDDIAQMAVWKLSSDKDPDSPTYEIPFFCVENDEDAGYPWINTVKTDNDPRNDAANAKVLEALAHNVALDGDTLLPSSDPAVISPTESSVTVRACLERHDRSAAVGNDGLEGVRVLITTTILLLPPVVTETMMYTDANGCVEFEIIQPISGNWYPTAEVTFCTMAAWPVEITPCDEREKQDLIHAPRWGEVTEICTRLPVPGDQWLSVELTSFAVLGSADGVDLMWRTASETDMDYWELERARSGSDEFVLLATLAADNSATGSEYHYFDRMGVAGYRYDYRLVDVSLDGTRTAHPNVESAVYGDVNAGAVSEYELGDAYPNPFNPKTTIRYAVPEADVVTITVYDINGREIAELVRGHHDAGQYSVTFNAGSLSSGTYFYTMQATGFSMTKKLLLLK